MKNKRKIFFLLLFFIGFIAISFAADPPPVDGDPTGGGTPVGGSAPIDTGYLITLSLAIAYGTYNYFKKNIHLKLTRHEK
ncbi:MAG: hypothetical protein QM504_10620 [Pseudomonadota bacterium]